MWDPTQYLTFADHRGRPYGELVGRIGATSPRTVADLGCGPGNLTVGLRDRWPDARVVAVDSSAEMVAAARDRGLDAQLADVAGWMPTSDVDVVVSNATLQWIPGHRDLITRWAGALAPGSWLAFQVPGNFEAASHRAIRDLAASPRWHDRLAGLRLRGGETVEDPVGYATILRRAGARVDAWETTYLQELEGPDAVLEWVTGTALTPIRDVLDDAGWDAFRADLAPILRTAYPEHAPGRTWFPFRRVFVVAEIGA
ncbi:MAG: trans-aconitate 2-methyltransferase [Gordonia paraffinivorans]